MGVAQLFTVDVKLGISSLQPVPSGALCRLRHLTWSPDDRFIAFGGQACDSNARWAIRRTEVATSQVTTLISETGKDLRNPDWRRF
jgi:hypothetical protein